MRNILQLAAVLAAAAIAAPLAAQTPPAARTPPASAGDAERGAGQQKLDAQLEAARARLDAAAREVAELSSESAGPVVDRVIVYSGGPRRAIIGVLVDPTSDRTGVRVAQVSPGGPAAEAGLLRGDVIVALGGTEFAGTDDPARALVERMRDAAPDEKLHAKVLRDGKAREFDIVTRRSPMPHFDAPTPPYPGRPGMPAIPAMPGLPPMPDAPGAAHGAFVMPFPEAIGSGLEGLELANLSPRLGRYFGTERGVLVLRAPDTGPWKLQDGDVIQSIDGRVPTSGSHATRILRSYQAGETLKIKVWRDRKALEVEVEAPGGDTVIRRERRIIRTD
jgi:S1-C subfamily serine protease